MNSLAIAWKAQPPADPGATELLGSIATVAHSFPNEDDTFTVVAHLRQGGVLPGVVDSPDELRPNRHYRFLGRWDEHPKHGWQFVFSTFVPDAPIDDAALAAFLVKWCPGVGDVTAGRLVDAFGPRVVDVLITDPQQAVDAGLLKPLVAARAGAELSRVYDPALRNAHLELFSLFKGLGFPNKALKESLKKWRREAAKRVRHDPF